MQKSKTEGRKYIVAFNQELYEIGARIVERREELGMTATELAIQANISAKTLSKIESGQSEVKIGTLVAIATALKVSLDYLQPKKLDQYSAMPKGMPALIEKINKKNYRRLRKKFFRFLQQLLKLHHFPRN